MTRPLIAMLIAACATDCERAGQSSEPGPAAQESPSDRIEQLRSLPYLGYTEEKAEPRQMGVTFYDQQRSCPGYNLYAGRRPCAAFLIDATGRMVHSWHDPSGQRWAACELLPNGDLVAAGSDVPEDRAELVGGASHYLLRLAWDSSVVWKRKIAAHHDVELTPAGRILTLTFRARFEQEINREFPVRDDVLVLLSEDGADLDERSLYDILHSEPTIFTFQHVEPKRLSAVPWVDLLHTNSVEWVRHHHLEDKHPIYDPSNVLICSRHQDMIAIVNWDSGKPVWAWGQGQISGPHDATMLDNGHILLFDNGLGRRWSRVIELDPLTEQIVWEYKAPKPTDFYTASHGTSQRLENGNTLITESENGRVFEVTPDGEIVWEFWNPHIDPEGKRATLCRMKRYDARYVEAILSRFETADGPDGA